ncbi:MAG TPA: hypothetical protein VL295_01345 [Gemmatimonadales bacterium]|nr:hypothetical protein [Gemmatimonadales bacterium]
MNTVLHWAPWVSGLLAVTCLGVGVAAFRGKRFVTGSISTLVGLLWVSGAALLVALGTGLAGYRALTREDVALTILVTPLANGRFLADARFPEGRAAQWEIAGDQLYVDARILKWKGVANLLGLHTVYELDRIGGRYIDIEQERTAPRTIFELGAPKKFDLFAWIKQKTWMAPLVDAEYGSGTFIEVKQSAIFEVRVSTTGLLIRKVD